MAILVCSVTLIAWGLGWGVPTEASGAIRPRTLVCVLLAGLALRQWHVEGASRAGRAIALIIAGAGLVTIALHAATGSPGTHESLYADTVSPGFSASGRLSLPSSIIVTCIGLALWCLHSDRSPRWVEGHALVGAAMCLVATIGHLYHVDELFAPFSRRGIALAPSLLLGCVCGGVLIARPDRGAVSLLATERPAGVAARALVGPVLFAPVLFGALSLTGVRAGLYDPHLAMALVAVATIAVFGMLAAHLARALLQLDSRLQAAQARLVQAHRMDAARYLAGWTCHEFNNLLTTIHGYADLIVHEKDPEVVRQNAAEVITAARACASLTRDLLQFSGHEVTPRETPDLSGVLSELEPEIASMIGPTIQLTLHHEREARVLCSRAHLEHVLLQLVLNARDAMSDHGSLCISVERSSDVVHPTTRLRVTDTGHGMPPEVLARALEPFFTTKDRGRGKGMRVATVSGIVSQCGGRLEIDSRVGEGTTVTIHWPRP